MGTASSVILGRVLSTNLRRSRLGRRLSFSTMVHVCGYWGAPSVIAAFAGFVHDRESTANDERDDNNDGY